MNSPAKLFFALLFLDRPPAEALRLYSFGIVSVVAHLLFAFGLFLLPLTGWLAEPPPEAIAIEIVDVDPAPAPEPAPEPEPEAPPVPAPEPEPEPIPEPERVVRRERPTAPPPSEAPPAEEPPPAEETVADFSGMTLSNDEGASWAAAAGNGAPIDGPIGRPGAQVTGRNRRGNPEGTPGARGSGDGEDTDIVPMRDLSQRPGPPNSRLEAELRRTFPREARNLGIDGSARVRLRVEPTGRVRVLRVVSEDHTGFGDACREAIRRSGRWDAPRDRHGDAVTTVLTFRCTFRSD